MADNNITKITCNEDDPILDPTGQQSTADSKWLCEYCTYANYPSALKCVMCCCEKTSLDIFRLNSKNLATSEHRFHEEETPPPPLLLPVSNTPVDSSSQQQQQPRPLDRTETVVVEDGKWSCAVCTYLNWPIALRCTQCLTERDKSSSPLLDATNTQEDLLTAAAEHLQRTLTIRSSPDGGGGGGVSQGAIGRRKVSPSAGTTSLAKTTTTTCYSSAKKWQCSECTYENFPKSQKCSMCGTANYNNSNNKNNNNNNSINKMNNKSSSRSSSSSPVRVSPTTIAVGGGVTTPIIESVDEKQSVQLMNNNNNLEMFTNTAAAAAALYSGSSSPTNTNSLARKGKQHNTSNNNNNSEERQLLRKLRKHGDWRWLHACLGVVENNFGAVEEYLSYGGSPGRALTQAEVSLLNRNSAFDVGFTLIHLAIRFQREDMLPMMLSQISGSGSGIKRVPSYVAPDLAADIRRQFSTLLRVSRNGQFNCHYVKEHATFSLPSEIEDLPVAVQEQLYEELLDKDAQKQLENPPPVVNWSLEITVRLGSRLVVLWNRSAGDCLLDSTMQATWGIFDRDNVLRRALADSLHQCAHLFYPRWKEYEMIQASLMHFQLEEVQWQTDWSNLLALASQPGASLEQLHIFALAHIFRRPIIVYGVKFVKSFRGEDIGLARFEGVYLPLLWEPSFCTRSPIALGYTRGHFSALVPTESYATRLEASANEEEDVTFLPLMDCEMKLLPIHFINETEMGREESLMRQWLDVCMTEGGLMVAQQRLNRPLLVAQMTEEWLNYYRRLAQVFTAPFARRPPHQLTGYSSDGDTEED